MSPRKPVPPMEVGRGPEAVRAAYRVVVNGDQPRVVHAHGQPGRAMTAFEVWQFLLDVPDGEQPVVAELVTDGGGTMRFEVRGAYAADGIGEVVIELIERGRAMGGRVRTGTCPECHYEWGEARWPRQSRSNSYSGCPTCGFCY